MTPGLQFPATEHHHTLAKIKLYCLVTEIDVWATWPVVTVSITWSRQSWSNREHNGANRSECFAAADEKNTLVMIKRSTVVLHCCNRFEANVRQRIPSYFTLRFGQLTPSNTKTTNQVVVRGVSMLRSTCVVVTLLQNTRVQSINSSWESQICYRKQICSRVSSSSKWMIMSL